MKDNNNLLIFLIFLSIIYMTCGGEAKYEYKTKIISNSYQNVQLDLFGIDGWKVIDLEELNDGKSKVVLERIK